MAILVFGLSLFLGVHFLPLFGSVRAAVVARLGEQGYRGAFSLVSLLGFALIVWGKGQAPFEALYHPPTWGRHVAMALMLPALIFVVAPHFQGNIKRRLKHPMLIGVMLWALSHLFSNGDLASLLLFGGFGLYSLVDILSFSRRKGPEDFEARGAADFSNAVAGVFLYLVLLWAHPLLFGPSLLG